MPVVMRQASLAAVVAGAEVHRAVQPMTTASKEYPAVVVEVVDTAVAMAGDTSMVRSMIR
jgi:hypothetical protein